MGAEAEASGSPYLPLWFSRHWRFRTHTPLPSLGAAGGQGLPWLSGRSQDGVFSVALQSSIKVFGKALALGQGQRYSGSGYRA